MILTTIVALVILINTLKEGEDFGKMDQEGLLKLQAMVGEVVMEEMGDGVEVMEEVEEVEMVVEVMVVEVEVID